MKPLHLAYIFASWLRRLYWIILRPEIHGVKVVVLHGDTVLLIRHSYQSPGTYMLPGGGVDRNETAEQAAQREVLEETGCAVTNLRHHGDFLSTAEGARNHIHIFTAQTADTPMADGREIIEACFFPVHALPATLSPASGRRIVEVRDGLPPSSGW